MNRLKRMALIGPVVLAVACGTSGPSKNEASRLLLSKFQSEGRNPADPWGNPKNTAETLSVHKTSDYSAAAEISMRFADLSEGFEGVARCTVSFAMESKGWQVVDHQCSGARVAPEAEPQFARHQQEKREAQEKALAEAERQAATQAEEQARQRAAQNLLDRPRVEKLIVGQWVDHLGASREQLSITRAGDSYTAVATYGDSNIRETLRGRLLPDNRLELAPISTDLIRQGLATQWSYPGTMWLELGEVDSSLDEKRANNSGGKLNRMLPELSIDDRLKQQRQASMKLEGTDCTDGEQIVPRQSQWTFVLSPQRTCWTIWLVVNENGQFNGTTTTGNHLVQVVYVDGTTDEFEDGPTKSPTLRTQIRRARFKSFGQQPVTITFKVR